MDHQFGELQNFIEQVGREGNKQKVLLERRGGGGSSGQESVGEQAALPNFRDSHLKRTSAHIQITRSRGQTAFRRVILGEVSVTNGSDDVMEQRPAWGGSMRPPLSCSQAYLQETKKEKGFRNVFQL